ncbi:MAG TPA: primosomal protein N' [Ktedonobacteraceae bacterium]|nr:primosomal protein N' [Ktedonobacteraceae bacterium]
MEVLVADAAYHGNEPLTYASTQPLQSGQLVYVPLRSKQALGVVSQAVSKPTFATKPVLEVLALPVLPQALLKTLSWMQEYYPSPLGVITQQFLPKSLPKKYQTLQATSVALSNTVLPPLTASQHHVVTAVKSYGMHMLHGATGSGKTRTYIELARSAFAAGRSSLILTPEIGLTSQLANDFRTVFGSNVVIIHSQLSDSVRQRLWTELLVRTGPAIVIGPRSALFSPLPNVGLIVLDEAHETAYKQDQSPYYHAARVASKLGELHHASVILGSATPLVTDYYIAQAKHRPILEMSGTAAGGENQADVQVVDLRDHRLFTKRPHLSDKLLSAIQETLARKEQVLLFLNRRGTARVVFCEDCGWQATCPHCDIPLVYHGDSHSLRCHSCDYKGLSPVSCPECHHSSIVFKSIGTKAIADDIAKLFPEAVIQRFDTDNKKEERIENNYESIREGKVDILIGTQTVAKGLDFPNLGLVGIIIADTGLFFPDFSAQERTYQLLSQVVGRVGRGHRKSQVIIQTYDPGSPLLKAVMTKEWQTFYETELRERKTYLFPPYCYLLKLTCRRASQAAAQSAAQRFATQLRSEHRRIIVEGPAPSFHERIQNKYQWQLIIKAKDRRELVDIVRHMPANWSFDIDPLNLL